jgi:hypothetical protein
MTIPDSRGPGRYGRPIVRGESLGGHGRLLTLALTGILVATSCSVIAEEPFAVVPPTREPRDEDPDAGSRRPDRGRRKGPAAARPSPALDAVDLAPDATPRPTPRPTPRDRVIRLRPRPSPGRFAINLYRRGDFVHQQTKDWCVAGSTQTMLNIVDDGRADRSARTQERLYVRGRRLSPDKRKLGPIGVDLVGWAELLNTAGVGPYVVDGAATRKKAIRMAARALRRTGRPVGLVTWRGAHSWVMSGFTATADPAYTGDFKVTAVYIQDVWYPYVSTIWGASRPPNSLVPVAALAEDYLPYRRPRARWPNRDGKFMLILPTLPPNTIAR